MLKALTVAAATFAALSCALPAQAANFAFQATLTGPGEAPANSSTAVGLGLVTFNDVALTMTVNELYLNLTGGTVTGSHIHCCTDSANTGTAPVVVDFMSAGFPTTTSGNYDNTFALSSATFNQLLTGATAGKAYLNIHNAMYPSGEIRGFLVSAVPEPGTVALMCGGLAALGLLTRRRRSNASRTV